MQGPFAIPAAKNLHASMAGTTMPVAMGESVANMLEPFFALPILAIAGIGMRRVMGFMVLTFFIALICYGISLLTLLLTEYQLCVPVRQARAPIERPYALSAWEIV